MLKLRQNFLPKLISEFISLGFVFFILPAIYIFEISVAIPAYYAQDIDSWWPCIHSILGTYVMFNLLGNLIGVIFVDTGFKGAIVDPVKVAKEGWHFCSVCEKNAPPRTWHCNVCNSCILKREHHCGFTGCCVGFYNFRFFYYFLLYLFISSIYATFFNHVFIWSLIGEANWTHIVRIVMPLSVIFFGIDTSWTQIYMFYYSVTIIGCGFSGVMLYQQCYVLFRNQTSYDRNKSNPAYNCDLKKNIQDSLGSRWYLTWISPFLDSPLPHQGMVWQQNPNILKEISKSK